MKWLRGLEMAAVDWNRMEWWFEVERYDPFIISLGGRAYPDFEISPQGDEYVTHCLWTSPHFNDLSSPQAVLDRAAALKMLFDGALILGENKPPYKFKRFTSREKSYHSLSIDGGNVLVRPFSDAYLDEPFRPAFHLGNDFIGSALFAARYHSGVASLLAAIGYSGLNWISLYQLSDTLKANKWDETVIVAKGFASKTKLKAFGNTANNSALLGPLARHGQNAHPVPTAPMTINEAIDLWLPIARAFVDDIYTTDPQVIAEWQRLSKKL